MTGDAQEPLVFAEREGSVAVLTLHAPKRRNALRYESWTALHDALSEAQQDPELRAVVITGSGRFFSAGGDLKQPPAHGHGPLAPAGRVELAQGVLMRLRDLPVPVVAAVEGAAVGLGWSLALACDLIVAADNAYFAAPFLARAVVPDGGLAWQLTSQLGRHRAARFLLQGQRLSALDAMDIGIVAAVVPPGSARTHAIALAEEVGAHEKGAFELTKRLINAAEHTDPAAFRALELGFAVVAQQRPESVRAREDFT